MKTLLLMFLVVVSTLMLEELRRINRRSYPVFERFGAVTLKPKIKA